MKIGIIGYGKMGKVIEEIAEKRGHQIVTRVNSSHPIESAEFGDMDVAIEFTAPHLAVRHIEYCADNNTPVVVGTTAWNHDLPIVIDYVNSKNGALLYASNFSIGVNIFFEINRQLARMMEGNENYAPTLEEIHHTAKLDAPSGTAVSLANDILDNNFNVNSWIHEENKKPEVSNDQLAVTSFREKGVPGTHLVRYESEIDKIEIKHTAHNRMGFALGAVIAAEWLHGKEGIYTMADVIKF